MLVNRAEPIYRQIALHFEKEIFEGRLKAGDKLPSTQELVAQFGVNHESIQSGLKILADRGLIERRRKCGTFVKASCKGKTIALVFERSIYGNLDMAFFNILMDRLASLILSGGWGVKYYATSDFGNFDHSIYELERDISSGVLSAVVNISAGDSAGAWLRKSCMIPYFICPINFDLPDFIVQGISHLAAHGRRHLVFIFDEMHLSRAVVEGALSEQASRHGLEPIPAFNAVPSQRSGYETAKRILDSVIPVDSFLVLYDNSFRGVLYHLLERGVKIPEEIALLSHSNKGIDIMCHMPLTRLEFDTEDFARQIFLQINARLEGGQAKVSPVKAKLVTGRTCGES